MREYGWGIFAAALILLVGVPVVGQVLAFKLRMRKRKREFWQALAEAKRKQAQPPAE